MSRSKRNMVMLVVGLLIGGLLALPVMRQVHDWRVARQMARQDALIREHAAAAALPYELVRAVVEVESGGDPRAESELGARGLMQVMPLTEQDVLQRNPDLAIRGTSGGTSGGGAGDLFDPDYNLTIGTTYLRHLLDRFGGDRTLALAAYHMGPTRVARIRKKAPGLTPTQLVERHGGPKTRAYVPMVLRRSDELAAEGSKTGG